MDIFETWIAKRKIAHRGLVNDAFPENTLGAFENAAAAGYAIELDVRSIDDGTVIVFHDETLGRLTNRDGYVSKLVREDLDEIRVGKSDEKIPTFREVLDLIDGRVPLLIEVKNGGAVGTLEKTLVEMLNAYSGEFAIESFNPYVLEYFKVNAPHFYRGQLAGDHKTMKSLPFFKRRALARMKLNKHVSCPHFIAYDLHALPNPYVAKYRKKIPILAWTVKSYEEYNGVTPFCDNVIFERYIPADPEK